MKNKNPGRPQKVSYYIEKGEKTYTLRFYNSEGKRTKKSAKTRSEVKVELLANDIRRLQLNPAANVDRYAYLIFFGKEPEHIPKKPVESIDGDLMKTLAFYKKRCEELEGIEDDYVELKKKFDAYLRTSEGRLTQAYDNTPDTNKVIEQYSKFVRNLSGEGKEHIRFIKKFMNSLDKPEKKVCEVTVADVYQFLENDYMKSSSPPERWNRSRKFLNKFFSWASKQWQFNNIITDVETKKRPPKEDILWHEKEEVEAVLSDLDLYWKTLVATLAYAGLSAHELRGLRLEDFIEKPEPMLRVAQHEESSKKTLNRVRNVRIHKTLLLPHLKAFMKKGFHGSTYIFPSKRSAQEQWTKDGLSKHLTGRKDIVKKGKVVKKGFEAILPQGMNCLSLRRTFGSLLLRDGKTPSEVAAAMGNTVDMVHRHYARILGDEVDIDF